MITQQRRRMYPWVLVCATGVLSLSSITARASHLSGSWTVLPSMSSARLSPFVTAVNGKLYVAGGNSGAGATNVLERYDPVTNTWTTLTPMPGARYQGGVVTLGTKIYVLGGWDAPASFIPTTTVQIYDTTTDTWSIGPSMPILSSSGPSGVIGGKIYKHTAEHGFSSPSQQFHVLDPNAGTWGALASLPIDHGGGAAGAINNKLYVASGWGWFGGTTLMHNQVHAYDPVTNSWSAVASIPTARGGVAGGVLGDHLLVAGGGVFGGPVLGTFEAYDATNDTWQTLPSMPVPIGSTAGAVIGNTFYVVGGHDGVSTFATLQAFTVPEPYSVALVALGLVSLCMMRRRKRVA